MCAPGDAPLSFQNCDWIRGSEAPGREVCGQLAARRSSPPEARLESSADSADRLAAVAGRRSCYVQPGKGRIDRRRRLLSNWLELEDTRARSLTLLMCRPHAPVGAAERARTATSVAILETSRFPHWARFAAHYSDVQPRKSKARRHNIDTGNEGSGQIVELTRHHRPAGSQIGIAGSSVRDAVVSAAGGTAPR